MTPLLRLTTVCLSLCSILPSSISATSLRQQIRQSPEVIEAYRTCAQFEQILADTLDFNLAYEATFTKNTARRRAIAIADGEFRGVDLSKVDDAALISAYKSRMQLFYLTILLAGPDTDEQANLYFPLEIKNLMMSDPPKDPAEFPRYAARLERGAKDFRAHIERLAIKYPDVAKRIREFRASVMNEKKSLPAEYKIEPKYGLYRSDVLKKDEPYYEIGSYTLIPENKEMKIVGIRFFTRLF